MKRCLASLMVMETITVTMRYCFRPLDLKIKGVTTLYAIKDWGKGHSQLSWWELSYWKPFREKSGGRFQKQKYTYVLTQQSLISESIVYKQKYWFIKLKVQECSWQHCLWRQIWKLPECLAVGEWYIYTMGYDTAIKILIRYTIYWPGRISIKQHKMKKHYCRIVRMARSFFG